MKKLIFLSLISVLNIYVASGQLTKIGGGLNYGTGFHYNNLKSGSDADLYRSPLIGIYLKGIIETKGPVQICPSFTFFIPRANRIPDIGSTYKSTKINEMMFSLDGHYVVIRQTWLELYGLAGLNITLATIKWSDKTFSPGVDNALGLNLGGGSKVKISEKIDLNAEVKYILGKYRQLMINAGLLINFNVLNKKED